MNGFWKIDHTNKTLFYIQQTHETPFFKCEPHLVPPKLSHMHYWPAVFLLTLMSVFIYLFMIK